MKVILTLVSLKALIILAPKAGMATTVRAVTSQLAQVQPDGRLKDELFSLIVKGKFAISDLEAAVKSVVYNEDFKQSTTKIGGTTSYQVNISNSRTEVRQKTTEVKTAQQAIIDFFDKHPDFVKSLAPAVRNQATPIVNLNFPLQIRGWEKEQRAQDMDWKCGGSTTHPRCL